MSKENHQAFDHTILPINVIHACIIYIKNATLYLI